MIFAVNILERYQKDSITIVNKYFKNNYKERNKNNEKTLTKRVNSY